MDVEPHVADGSTSICFPVMHRDATAITAKPLNTRFAPLPAHVLTDAAATAQLLLRSL
jgi:hypothetical protein